MPFLCRMKEIVENLKNQGWGNIIVCEFPNKIPKTGFAEKIIDKQKYTCFFVFENNNDSYLIYKNK